MNNLISDTIQQMEQISDELERLFKAGKFNYKKHIENQEVNSEEAEMFLYSSEGCFFYMIIRFCAFYDAYNYGFKNNSNCQIDKIFENNKIAKKKELRNIVLAHNYNEKTKPGNYINRLPDVLNGQYNNNICSSIPTFEEMHLSSIKVLEIIRNNLETES